MQFQILLTKSIVNCNFTKLILQNANLPLILLLQNVIDESRLSRPEEAGDDGDGGEFVLFAFGHGDGGFVGSRVDEKVGKDIFLESLCQTGFRVSQLFTIVLKRLTDAILLLFLS